MIFSSGDWVIVRNGKKAHKLVQGYNGPAKLCTPVSHSATGFSCSADFEQEELSDGSGAERCKRCTG